MKKFWMVPLILIVLSFLLAGCAEGSDGEATGSHEEESDDFPTQPIRLIVPLGAGSGTDAVARILAESVSEHLPNEQSVVVENMDGGATRTGTLEVVNAEPDGYTLGFNPSGSLTVQPHLGATYDPDSFQGIVQATSVPLIFYVQEDEPFDTFEEWHDYVLENPGEFVFGSSGTGTTSHLLVEMMDNALGTEMVHVPFDGGGDMTNALLGGDVDATAVFESSARPHVESGDIKALFNAGSTKPENLQDLPSLIDEGYEEVFVDTFMGVIGPKGIPQERIDILEDAFRQALEDPEVMEQFSNTGNDVVFLGSEDYDDFISETHEMLGPIIEDIGLADN